MRIQNNIMAVNTHRQYTIQQDKVSASTEKLSSGYRINKAADDAAGLAISEKMRAQIRGLNMAKRNTQDAVSLIQTAEGALQEVHAMLQRMNELADQSATGTNQQLDRTQIDKEFRQLKREINDISDQTTFNNMKLLDGSLSVKGQQRTAETTGIYTNYEMIDDMSSIENNISTTTIGGEGMFKMDFDTTGAQVAAGNTVTLSMNINGEQVTASARNNTSSEKTGNDIIALFAGRYFWGTGSTIYRATYDSANANQLQFDALDGQIGRINSVTQVSFSVSGPTPTERLNVRLNYIRGINDPVMEFKLGKLKTGSNFTEKKELIRVAFRLDGQTLIFDSESQNTTGTVDEWLESAFVNGRMESGGYILFYENGQFVLRGTHNDTFNESSIDTGAWLDSVSIQHRTANEIHFTFITNDENGLIRTDPAVAPGGFTTGPPSIPRAFDFTLRTLDDLNNPIVKGDILRLHLAIDGKEFEITRTIDADGLTKEEVLALFADVVFDMGNGELFTGRIDSSRPGTLVFTSNSTTTFTLPHMVGPPIEVLHPDATPSYQSIWYPDGDARGWSLDISLNDVVLSDGLAGMKAGDVFTIDGQKYELVSPSGQKQHADALEVLWRGPNLESDLSVFLQSMQQAMDKAGGRLTVEEYTGPAGEVGFTIKQSRDGTGDVEAKFEPASMKLSTMEIDPYRLKDGDEVAVTLTDKYGEEKQAIYVHRKGNSFEDIKSYFAQSFSGYTTVTGKSNKIMFDVGGIDVALRPIKEAHGELRIQVGALEGEQLSIGIDSMNTAGLGLDGVTIDTQDKAGSAITAVRSAIDKVSDQRAYLGAMQNRLEYKMKNLANTVENLSAAESRIRDVDMADEMARLTISNILMQATVSMLAQANSNPQNVLSLLR